MRLFEGVGCIEGGGGECITGVGKVIPSSSVGRMVIESRREARGESEEQDQLPIPSPEPLKTQKERPGSLVREEKRCKTHVIRPCSPETRRRE